MFQVLADELTHQYGIPKDQAVKITTTYLKQFRKCPENAAFTLNSWRSNLWSNALGEQNSHLTGAIYERWLQLRYHYLRLSKDTISMLHLIKKKYYLGLISNGPSNSQWEKIRKLHLEQYFDTILVSGDLPWEKPEARIFQEACQFLQVRPESCIMVGDKLETDILGGIEAGFACTIWIPIAEKSRLSSEDPKPNYTIKNICDLSKILNRGPDAPELEDCSSNASDGM
ncbi:N-acylneuraminate-9-phosphatase [Leptopilina heterotoma]|uniref:N-acylneuraminate-9-phosphatase n=1 Tax=Leptopilina heterotoma TaxID=63436 RepID=UPI001CA8B4A8|nr:N-acylneuraminate-9-phosphatase [Leptopilina heterotoma]